MYTKYILLLYLSELSDEAAHRAPVSFSMCVHIDIAIQFQYVVDTKT